MVPVLRSRSIKDHNVAATPTKKRVTKPVTPTKPTALSSSNRKGEYTPLSKKLQNLSFASPSKGATNGSDSDKENMFREGKRKKIVLRIRRSLFADNGQTENLGDRDENSEIPAAPVRKRGRPKKCDQLPKPPKNHESTLNTRKSPRKSVVANTGTFFGMDVSSPEDSDHEDEFKLQETNKKCCVSSSTSPAPSTDDGDDSASSDDDERDASLFAPRRRVSVDEEPADLSDVGDCHLVVFLAYSDADIEAMRKQSRRNALEREKRSKNPLMAAYNALHTSSVPDQLWNREEHCQKIEKFIKTAFKKNATSLSRSLYISGVPGTGKTACVTKVIDKLKKSKLGFTYVYINALELSKPQDIFPHMLHAIHPGKRLPALKTARTKLEDIFTTTNSKRPFVILVIDELDMLLNSRQDVVFDIFNWCSTDEAKLIVIAIANTLDLPERTLKTRVASRVGFDRLIFAPYNHQELIDIIKHRIGNLHGFGKESTLGLISRKVATVSGDLRRALEIMRRAVEIAVDKNDTELDMTHTQAAIKEANVDTRLIYAQQLRGHTEVVLRVILSEFRATGFDEVLYHAVYDRYRTECLARGYQPVDMLKAYQFVSTLESSGWLITKDHNACALRKISFNIPIDEVEQLLKQAASSSRR